MLHNRVPKPRQWQGHQACVVGSAANASTACVAIVAPEFDAATHLGERSRTGSSRPWLERAEEELAAGDAGTALERAAALVVSGLWRSTRRSGQSGRRAERERKGGKSSGRLNRAPGWEWDGSRGSGAVIESTNAPCFSFGTRFWVIGWVGFLPFRGSCSLRRFPRSRRSPWRGAPRIRAAAVSVIGRSGSAALGFAVPACRTRRPVGSVVGLKNTPPPTNWFRRLASVRIFF